MGVTMVYKAMVTGIAPPDFTSHRIVVVFQFIRSVTAMR